MRLAARIAACAACLTAANPTPCKAEADHSYYLTGNPADVKTPARPLVVMQGGGEDVDSVL